MKYYIWDKNKETEKQETEKAVTAKLQPEEAENLQGIRILTAEDNEPVSYTHLTSGPGKSGMRI